MAKNSTEQAACLWIILSFMIKYIDKRSFACGNIFPFFLAEFYSKMRYLSKKEQYFYLVYMLEYLFPVV